MAHSPIVVSLLNKKQCGPALRTRRAFYCGKMLTVRGVAEHERHACRKNPNRRKRSFGKKQCAVCGKAYHAAGLRAHMATQHPLEFAKEKARRRPRSRSAQRREMAARAEASRARRHERSTSPASLGERAEYAAGGQRKHLPHPHVTSSRKAATKPVPVEPRDSSRRAQSNKPTVVHPSGSATGRAWAEIQQKMSKAAAK